MRAAELETEVATAKKKKEDLEQKLHTLEAGREAKVKNKYIICICVSFNSLNSRRGQNNLRSSQNYAKEIAK